MADHEPFKSALDALYGKLGVVVAYHPKSGPDVTVTAIVDREPAGEGLGSIGLATNAITLKVRAADLKASTPESGDKVDLEGAIWRAGTPRIDGRGLQWEIPLRRE